MFELVLAAAVPDVRRVLRLGAGRNQPAAVRSGRSGIGTGRRLHGRVRLDALHDVHARRIRGDLHHVRHGRRSCSSAAGCRRCLIRRSPGCRASSGSCSRRCSCFSCSRWSKAIVPRYRYDQLMRLGWKVFLPLSLAMVVIVAALAAVRPAGSPGMACHSELIARMT